ncbi:MAG TPA: pirin family protein [Candidatus Avacidaminococcus intestinavium]|uniref:Pirin family protein n=1 Tax=Candidatus Avacidaminococcus intestinavium TaxID=2840684 RepID=A0A9D1MPN8_9FIRM|nr:pirin family protein [Candidatus Avacidaminococcus intestinavium]
MKKRTIKKIVTGRRTEDGAGVKLVRVISRRDAKEFDPFLMLDAFDSVDPADYTKGFPWHPHRGIETITYLVEGEIAHGDSLGNKGSILSGGCQWMTAGSGIIHQEMPKASPRMLGLQLWLNLPAKDKMTEPKYNDLVQSAIPVACDAQSKVHIIAGTYADQQGAFAGQHIKPLLLDVELQPKTTWSLPVPHNDTVFFYILSGAASFEEDGELLEARQALLFTAGDQIEVTTGEQAVRFFVMAASPLREPIAWGGPIVMNTDEELELAFKELQDNTFIKHKNIVL